MQFEHNSSRAKKKPFTPGDVLIFRILTAMISEKFQALAMEVADGVKKTSTGELTEFIKRTASLESHKTLCRSLQDELAA